MSTGEVEGGLKTGGASEAGGEVRQVGVGRFGADAVRGGDEVIADENNPWIDKFVGDCWGVVNGLACDTEEGNVTLDEVRLSEEQTLQYCRDQVELLKAMAVDLGFAVEAARAKAAFLLRFVNVVSRNGTYQGRCSSWERDIHTGYVEILRDLLRINTIIDMREIETEGHLTVPTTGGGRMRLGVEVGKLV